MSSHYFDLIIKLKSEQENQFRNIQRNEYHNLFSFINTKGLKIINLGDTETIGGVAAALQNSDDEAVDPHLEQIKKKINVINVMVGPVVKTVMKRMKTL
jgi:structure-specific recognition protein 1